MLEVSLNFASRSHHFVAIDFVEINPQDHVKATLKIKTEVYFLRDDPLLRIDTGERRNQGKCCKHNEKLENNETNPPIAAHEISHDNPITQKG